MKCPVCSKDMTEQDFGTVMVDACKDGCKGVWFDWHELLKLDEKNEGCGEALKEALSYPRTNDEGRGQINCPKCSIPLHIHKYQSAKEINVDECYDCGGFFLDSGELTAIKENFLSEEERLAYAQKLIDEIPEFAKAKADSERINLRTEAINKYTKFLRASYYLAGGK